MEKKESSSYNYVIYFGIGILVLSFLFAGLVVMQENKQSNVKVFQGNSMDEALFLNQCNFYNFLLKGNNKSQRFKCPEENK